MELPRMKDFGDSMNIIGLDVMCMTQISEITAVRILDTPGYLAVYCG